MLGFISKKRVEREIKRIYDSLNNTPCPTDQFKEDCAAQSALNLLISRLGLHRVWEIK